MTDWIRDALDAVRTAVRSEFPATEIPDMHVSQTPRDFKRPAFFVQMIPGRVEHLSASLVGYPSSWQVVYFPPENADGLVDGLALMNIADRMTSALGRALSLRSPNGVTYDVNGFSCDLRDGLGFFTVDLWTSMRRPEPDADKMRDILLELNTEE